MNCRQVLATAALATFATATPLFAADTPGTDPAVRKPSADERMTTARTAIQSQDWGKAINELNTVIKEDPNHADAHNLLGYSWRKRANPDLTKAYSHYYTALRINPKHKGAHEYIGQAYLLEKRIGQAEQHLAELEKICGGTACPEYQELSKSITEFKTRN
jgi:Flp pilus assembly protein TadD